MMHAPSILRRAAVLAGIAAAAALAGCENSITTGGVRGTYQLTAVNGQPLPFTIPGTAAGTTVRLVQGRLTIGDNRDFTHVMTFNTTTDNPNDVDPGQSTSTVEGLVDINGSEIRFEPDFEPTYTGTLSGSQITFTRRTAGADLQFTYRK